MLLPGTADGRTQACFRPVTQHVSFCVGKVSSIYLSRRRMLQFGGLAPLGLSLPALLAGEAGGRANAAGREGDSLQSTFGRAKRCLLLFMWGGPAHQDLWDLKPDAPDNIRGEFQPIATNVPGIQISELLPQSRAKWTRSRSSAPSRTPTTTTRPARTGCSPGTSIG